MIYSRAVSDFLFLFYGLGHIISIDSSMYVPYILYVPLLSLYTHMQFFSHSCLFTDITDCVLNVCVLDSLGAIRRERELSLVGTHMHCDSCFLCTCCGCVHSENHISEVYTHMALNA